MAPSLAIEYPILEVTVKLLNPAKNKFPIKTIVMPIAVHLLLKTIIKMFTIAKLLPP